MDVLHSAWLLCYKRCLFSVLELHVDTRYDWWVMAPSTHHSLFPMSNLYVLTLVTWKLQVIQGHSAYWTTALLSETFLVCFRVAWEIWPESYSPRHASVVRWYNICVRILQARTSIATCVFVAQLRMTTKPMYDMTAYHTPNDGFTANKVSFYKSVVDKLHYVLQCLFK